MYGSKGRKPVLNKVCLTANVCFNWTTIVHTLCYSSRPALMHASEYVLICDMCQIAHEYYGTASPLVNSIYFSLQKTALCSLYNSLIEVLYQAIVRMC